MKKVMEQPVEVTEEVILAILNDEKTSKSKKMIAMFDLGLEVKDISEVMTKFEGALVRYNFVYNVVSNYCNMNGIKHETSDKENKKDQIIAMWLVGASNKEISIDLKANYNYVFNTIKSYKLANPGVEPKKATEETAAAKEQV